MPLAEHRLLLRYEGGDADQARLQLYDGTLSVHGMAQAISIATHAYLTGEVVSRATALRGANLYLRPARRGSFFLELVALIEAYPATSTSLVAISAPVFYDFVKLAMKRATGLLDYEPETPHIKRQLERKEPTFDEGFLDNLAEKMEGSSNALTDR